jgi:hypothetical protein
LATKYGEVNMTIWNRHDIGNKVLAILDVRSHQPNHHFGRPFLTPYQIAIEFKRRHPADCQQIGKPVGGKDTGQQNSIAQYIAQQLSRRIKAGDLPNVEGRFLNRQHLFALKYEDGGGTIESSSMHSYDLSMYRRTD